MVITRAAVSKCVLCFLFSGIVFLAQAMEQFKPGQNILAWGQAVEEEAMKLGIVFDVRAAPSKTTLTDGSVVRFDETLIVELNGARAGDYSFKLYVDDGTFIAAQKGKSFDLKRKWSDAGPHWIKPGKGNTK